jgi:hypothetical protein
MREALAIIALLATGLAATRAAPEIVVAIRYLKAQGTSHSQLFLYREDGKLLRQLTNDASGQMTSPMFAPDGQTIIFTRETNSCKDYWSIEPKGGNLHSMPGAPIWYTREKTSPFFTNLEDESDSGPNPNAPSDQQKTLSFKAPDGSVELILNQTEEEDDQYNGPGHGKHYQIRDLLTGDITEFQRIPGFEGVYEILHGSQDKNERFLIEPSLRLAFFGLHLNSTDGDTCYALDLTGRRLVRLSPNWAAPIPLPGESAFLTLTEVHYVAIPRSSKTANSSYMEYWDANFHKIRYSKEGAAICYGASMYRPGRTPAVVSISNFRE